MHAQQPCHAQLRPRARGYVGAMLMAGILVMAGFGLIANQRYQAASREAWIDRTADALTLQSTVVTTAVLACGASYTKGDNGDPQSASDAKRFPSSSSRLENIQCPGAPANAKFILRGRDGAFVTPLPAEFGAWAYSNSQAGLSFAVPANSSLAVAAARKAAKQIGGHASFDGSTLAVTISYPALPPEEPASSPQNT
jgi:hypothetical protein